MTHRHHLPSVIQSVIFSLAAHLSLSTVITALSENVRCGPADATLQMEGAAHAQAYLHIEDSRFSRASLSVPQYM